jgi:hypothetical protein
LKANWNYEKKCFKRSGEKVMAEKDEKQNSETESAQRIVSEVSSINHEINNHLTTIIGNADLILLTNPGLDLLVKKKLNIILAESRIISELNKKLRSLIKTGQ